MSQTYDPDNIQLMFMGQPVTGFGTMEPVREPPNYFPKYCTLSLRLRSDADDSINRLNDALYNNPNLVELEPLSKYWQRRMNWYKAKRRRTGRPCGFVMYKMRCSDEWFKIFKIEKRG